MRFVVRTHAESTVLSDYVDALRLGDKIFKDGVHVSLEDKLQNVTLTNQEISSTMLQVLTLVRDL